MKRYLIFAFVFLIFSCSEKSNEQGTVKGEDKLTVTRSSTSEKPSTSEGLITAYSIDRAYLGMDIDELKRLYKNFQQRDTLVYYFGIDGEEGELLIAKDNKPLIYAWPKEGKIVGLYALSNTFRTKSNLRPGMTIKEVKDIYPNIKISQDAMSGNNETIYIPQEKVALGFFTEQKTIGVYRNQNEVEPTTSEFKSDTFRVQYIEITM